MGTTRRQETAWDITPGQRSLPIRFLRDPLLVAQTGSLLLLTALVLTRYWQDHHWIGWGAVATTTLIWLPALGQRLERNWWFVYVAGIFVYTLLRSYADETAIPTQVTYPIKADAALFFGTDPVRWLQSLTFDRRDIDPLDWTAVGVHWSFFFTPHVAAVAIFLFLRRAFAVYAGALVITMYIGLAMFFLVPTAPPWMAAADGELDNVYRVLDFALGSVNSETYDEFYESLAEPNSVAAMPSIHMAATFLLVAWSWRYFRPLVYPAVAYTVIMGIALMYLGEHYLVDELAGIAVAAVAFILALRFVPRRVGLGSANDDRPTAAEPAAANFEDS